MPRVVRRFYSRSDDNGRRCFCGAFTDELSNTTKWRTVVAGAHYGRWRTWRAHCCPQNRAVLGKPNGIMRQCHTVARTGRDPIRDPAVEFLNTEKSFTKTEVRG